MWDANSLVVPSVAGWLPSPSSAPTLAQLWSCWFPPSCLLQWLCSPLSPSQRWRIKNYFLQEKIQKTKKRSALYQCHEITNAAFMPYESSHDYEFLTSHQRNTSDTHIWLNVLSNAWKPNQHGGLTSAKDHWRVISSICHVGCALSPKRDTSECDHWLWPILVPHIHQSIYWTHFS